MEVVSDIKVEVEEESDRENMESINNNTKLDIEDMGDKMEAPLALVTRRQERDITERFPYIDEVTTTTPSRWADDGDDQDDQVNICRLEEALGDQEPPETDENIVTSSVDKGMREIFSIWSNI